MRGEREASRGSLHIVGVAHPAYALLRYTGKKLAGGGKNGRFPVFAAALCGGYLAPRHISHELVAVADAEDRYTQLKHRGVIVRGLRVVDAVRSAGKDYALIGALPYLIDAYLVIALYLRIDVLAAHAPCDELIVLSAEIKNKYFIHKKPLKELFRTLIYPRRQEAARFF